MAALGRMVIGKAVKVLFLALPAKQRLCQRRSLVTSTCRLKAQSYWAQPSPSMSLNCGDECAKVANLGIEKD